MVKIRVASPCSADWNRMPGTDRVRYCPECKLNVYNFSEMSEPEIQAIIAARTGRLCARFYQRADGTMLTKNCPVGFRGALLRATRFASATLTAFIALAQVTSAQTQSQSNLPLVHIQSGEKTLAIAVVDPSGAVITNAVISLKPNSADSQTSWITDEMGRAEITGLPSGPNDIFVSAPGFATKTLHFQSQATGSYTVRLDLGLMGEIVEVPPEPEHATMPTYLTIAAQPDLPSISKPPDHRNAFQRFLSKLRSIF